MQDRRCQSPNRAGPPSRPQDGFLFLRTPSASDALIPAGPGGAS